MTSSERDVDLLREKNRLLELENERLHKRLAELVAQVAELRGDKAPEQLALELRSLEEQLGRMNRRLFGDSSEKRLRAKESSERAPQTGHGPTRQERLPQLETHVELAPEERACTMCGGEMIAIEGMTEDSELIDVVRRQFVIRTIKRQKYRCRCGIGVKTAPPPVKHIARGRYSLDFAAHVATDKHVDHQPLDRQRRAMQRLGLSITTQTLWDQIDGLAELVEPVYEALRHYVLGDDVIGVDETWWRLMEKKPSKKYWAWAMSCPSAVWYGIAPSRSAKTAQRFLEGFEGTIICDGYKAYETLARENRELRLALCWSHARRRFVEAEPHYPQCSVALDLIGKLFDIDRDSSDPALLGGDEKTAAVAKRRKLRGERAPPILDNLRSWALDQRGLPKSGLRTAVDYLLSHWRGLILFVDDPFVPMHNNGTERALRGPVIGRKNHYGSRSERGTQVAAIYYSLLETAVLNDLDPHAYLTGAVYGLELGADPARMLPLKELRP